jgi:hypothetical protein
MFNLPVRMAIRAYSAWPNLYTAVSLIEKTKATYKVSRITPKRAILRDIRTKCEK